MDVELYVYDLSRGMARSMSMAFLGTQIDAVYHTALVFGGVEYFFGQGVQTCYPGSTHHGQPMQIIKLGRTELELEIILEYLESLKSIYTAESYDLFMHNCNNFSNDFATFLVGKGIPDHITSLPQTVLNTPFGQMLKPQLDQAMRGLTQAPVPASRVPPQTQTGGRRLGGALATKGGQPILGKVHNVSRLADLDILLQRAQKSCAVIFFTSSTCAPCRICYKPYDDLAAEFADKAVLVKVDISYASEIASRYQIRATPTFMTFVRGEKVEQWAGADPAKLTANIRLLVQMANPAHPHARLRLPTLQRKYEKPELYVSVPPLEKMLAKLGAVGQSDEVHSLKDFIKTRQDNPANAPLPDLKAVSSYVRNEMSKGQTDSIFALIDLVRVSLADPRVSGYFAEEDAATSLILTIISSVCDWATDAASPTKLVAVQLACNTFSTPLMARRLASDEAFSGAYLRMATWLLLDESRLETRKGAANLALNMLKPLHSIRLDDGGSSVALPEDAQVELAACLLEATSREEDVDTLKRLLLAVGLLVYASPQDGELQTFVAGMGGADTVRSKGLIAGVDKALIEELTQILA